MGSKLDILFRMSLYTVAINLVQNNQADTPVMLQLRGSAAVPCRALLIQVHHPVEAIWQSACAVQAIGNNCSSFEALCHQRGNYATRCGESIHRTDFKIIVFEVKRRVHFLPCFE